MICPGTIAVLSLPSCNSSTSTNLVIGIFICFRAAVALSEMILFAGKFHATLDCGI